MSGQLAATQCLCHLYGTVSPDQAQCIIYNQHQVSLLRNRGDRGQEGVILETISQLYLSLGTDRCVYNALVNRTLEDAEKCFKVIVHFM